MIKALKVFAYLVTIGVLIGGLYIILAISYQAYLGVNVFQ